MPKQSEKVEVRFFVGRPPYGTGHMKLQDDGWHGQLGLNADHEVVYMSAVKVAKRYDLDTAASWLKTMEWRIIWSWVGVHGD